MTPYGFVEVREASDSDLQRTLELADRLSRTRTVMLQLRPGARPRVEAMMDNLLPGDWRSRIEFLDPEGDPGAAFPAVQAAGYCVFSDAGLAAHLRDDQVAVYATSWKA